MIRFTVSRQAVFAVAFTIMLGCGYDSTTPYPSPAPNPAFEDGLWTASGINPAILHLAPSQLLTDGDRTPVTAITTPSAQLLNLNGVAFDTDGTLWIASQDDSVLVAFAPADLASSGSKTATRRITSIAGSLSAPTGLAFDPQHRLWVANAENGTIVRFDREQLAAGGAAVPAVTISGLGHPNALAFDAAGSLWVSKTNKVFSFSPAQLNTSGFLAPQVVISTLGTSLADPSGLAFDADGNLWVANAGNQTLVAFGPGQLATTGSPAPHIVISSNAGSLNVPLGLAFDADGSLWVMGGGGVDALEKFERTSLGATGAPSPAVRVRLTGFVLFWNAAFWPQPPGLPLN